MKMNLQPPEKIDLGAGLLLDVIGVWPTIQGEGPYTGTPATFIRLAGCNLQCPLCDTNYTSGRGRLEVEILVSRVRALKNQLVVITGGEPFRQNITELCRLLCKANYLVQVETNGAFSPPEGFYRLKSSVNSISCRLCVVCSPKTSKLAGTMDVLVDAWKYVVRAGEIEPDGMPTSALGMSGIPARPMNTHQIYIQPADEKDLSQNTANMKAAVDSCLKHGYRLCLQLHKIAGLD